MASVPSAAPTAPAAAAAAAEDVGEHSVVGPAEEEDLLFCDECEANAATLYCQDCQTIVCEQCDGTFHESSRQSHTRVPVNQRPVFCSLHNFPVEAYCAHEGRLACHVCVSPTGECAGHLERVIRVEVAVATAQEMLDFLGKAFEHDERMFNRERLCLIALREAIDERVVLMDSTLAQGKHQAAQELLAAAQTLGDVQVLQDLKETIGRAETLEKEMLDSLGDQMAWQRRWLQLCEAVEASFSREGQQHGRGEGEEGEEGEGATQANQRMGAMLTRLRAILGTEAPGDTADAAVNEAAGDTANDGAHATAAS
eukprot:m.57328 g.57328  ORF g.57328 m.57328 type:complete len:312 (-) comp12103_c1_seq2:107-1042(-)